MQHRTAHLRFLFTWLFVALVVTQAGQIVLTGNVGFNVNSVVDFNTRNNTERNCYICPGGSAGGTCLSVEWEPEQGPYGEFCHYQSNLYGNPGAWYTDETSCQTQSPCRQNTGNYSSRSSSYSSSSSSYSSDYGSWDECYDNRDNDNDGLTDKYDPDCSQPPYKSEGQPPMKPACMDGLDNDNDGLIDDWDPGCSDQTDTDESNAPIDDCADGLDNDGDTLVDDADPGCLQGSEELAVPECLDGHDNDQDDLKDTEDPGCWPDKVHGKESAATTQCQDGIDNDNDGLIDRNDPGCFGDRRRNGEADATSKCQDGRDNDNDGLTDNWDPGCRSPQDNDESDGTTQCQDGIDNDNDGVTDLMDPGCANNPLRHGEADATTQCQDGIDNDNDGMIDLQDPSCLDRTGVREEPPQKPAAPEQPTLPPVVPVTPIEQPSSASSSMVSSAAATRIPAEQLESVRTLRTLNTEQETRVETELKTRMASNRMTKKRNDLIESLRKTYDRLVTLRDSGLLTGQAAIGVQQGIDWLSSQAAYYSADDYDPAAIDTSAAQLRQLLEQIATLVDQQRAPQAELAVPAVDSILLRTGRYLTKTYEVLLILAREGIYIEPQILTTYQQAGQLYSEVQDQCTSDERACVRLREVLNLIEQMNAPLKGTIDAIDSPAVQREINATMEQQ